jgi:hypothetical protein
MTELVSHVTGVIVASLRKETAQVVDEGTIDPYSSKINEHETAESGVSLPPDVDEARPSAASSVEGSEPSPSDPSSLTEREILIQCSRDVLPMAADTHTPPASLAAIEKQYAADEFKKLSDDGIKKARAISASMRAVANTPGKLERSLSTTTPMCWNARSRSWEGSHEPLCHRMDRPHRQVQSTGQSAHSRLRAPREQVLPNRPRDPT